MCRGLTSQLHSVGRVRTTVPKPTTGANTMSWWKILILYLLLVGGMLWFLRRSRSFHEESEESQGD
ncbi:MAG TPA: LPXTG cell wall anchor domain-containing protein [Steroidobacteraceae bacterium]|nr:LPXTG cell wall anchor domain-containing protein [Steroidobacteraceae bacterium]